jgi:hypothetical protein
MIIDNATLTYIQNAIKTAGLVKIDSIVIEPGRVRAMDADRTVVLFHNENVPDMVFGSIGINRFSVFNSRVDIAKSVDNFVIDAVVDSSPGKDPFVRALQMKGKGVKVDYRCANPLTVQAPKNLRDQIVYRLHINTDVIQMIQKGQVAMSTDDITIICIDGGVSFTMTDINGDTLSYQFGDSVELVTSDVDTSTDFSYTYPIKLVHSLFKHNTNQVFDITTKGMIKITVNQLDFYILAKE